MMACTLRQTQSTFRFIKFNLEIILPSPMLPIPMNNGLGTIVI